MQPICLICTDLDGTLLNDLEAQYELRNFAKLLTECNDHWGTRWAVITGRRMIDMKSVELQFLMYGMRPDFLVVEDGLIYQRGGRGYWRPLWWWNFHVMRKRFHMGRRSGQDIRRWRDDLLAQFPEASDRSRQSIDLWIEFPDAAQTLQAELVLLKKISHTGDFQVFRWERELFLAPSVGTKGEAVRKICKKLNIPRQCVFAVGDGPNDLSMLDGMAAGMNACVANALDRIKEAVTQTGGYMAKQPKTAGVIEALEWYMRQAGVK